MKKTKTEKINLSEKGPEEIQEFTKNKTFFQNVYRIVKKIPEGKVTTYGNIAMALDNKSGARAVGYALNAVFNTDVPCHRVVNRNGELTGSIHFATPTMMKELLESERIEFINGRVNMKKHLWVPPNLS